MVAQQGAEPVEGGERMIDASTQLRRRVDHLRWLLPLSLALMSVLYQLGPAAWIHDRLSHGLHYASEIALYGLVGPPAGYPQPQPRGGRSDARTGRQGPGTGAGQRRSGEPRRHAVRVRLPRLAPA